MVKPKGLSSRQRNGPVISLSKLLLCTMFIIAGFVCFLYAPVPTPDSKSAIVPVLRDNTFSLKEEISDIINDRALTITYDMEHPGYNEEHLTPIDVTISKSGLNFELCSLNFEEYSKAPHLMPMFKDLVKKSNCGTSRAFKSISVLNKEIEATAGTSAGRVLYPSGFVFHESRVGSTLVANILGSDPMNMIFSESSPPASVFLRCSGCSHERQVQSFRNTILMMGRSPVHKRLFFKFQSITTTKMNIALEAFPDVPWIFLYRLPVQTMMSHMKGGAPPCLRSKRLPPEKVKRGLQKGGVTPGEASKEAWCAAHLNMLCEHALEAYDAFGTYDASSLEAMRRREVEGILRYESPKIEIGGQRGMLVDYESLPGVMPRLVLPHLFGIVPSPHWWKNMRKESQEYSKGRGTGPKAGLFKGDSADKENSANALVKQFSESILIPTFQKLTSASQEAVNRLAPSADMLPRLPDSSVDVAAVKKYPPIPTGSTSSISSDRTASVRTLAAGNTYDPFRSTHNSSTFENVDCPPTPSSEYPKTYNMKTLLDNWNPDDTNIPPVHYSSLCKFDYATERVKAEAYRRAEVPVIIYNHPQVNEVVQKWSDVDYLNKLVGENTEYKTETSKSNHFMYWRASTNLKQWRDKAGWVAPTGHTRMTFSRWLKTAVVEDNRTFDDKHNLYFRVSSSNSNSFLYKELPFFQPQKDVFMVDPEQHRGIHCRFGIRGVIAECHFDGSRNFAASFGGLRRWILAHPNQCENLHLYARGHPSSRHSEIDWSKPDFGKYPKFATAQANEVILKPGEVLYLPSYWFHYIVSLTINFQCSARSGTTREYAGYISKCGF